MFSSNMRIRLFAGLFMGIPLISFTNWAILIPPERSTLRPFAAVAHGNP